MKRLDGVVPYAIAPGNHDGLGSPTIETELFNAHFPVREYQGRATFGGVFESNKLDNSYHFFRAGGIDWLVLAYEFGPRDEVLAWANQVVASHPGHKVILVTHTHIYSDDTLHGSSATHYWAPKSYGRPNDPTDVWEKFIRRHANIVFVFNGHVLNDGAGRLVGVGDHGNKVYQMLANYQMYPSGGAGFLRLIECDPGRDRFTVQSYSPYWDFFLSWEKQQFAYDNLGLFNTNRTYQPSATQGTATVTIQDDDTDTAPPRLEEVRAQGLPPEITLMFSERVQPADAANTANYTIDHNVVVGAASLNADGQSVTLLTDSFITTGVVYTVTVNNIRDRSARANPITPGSRASFAYLPVMFTDNFNDGQADGWVAVDEGDRLAPSIWRVRDGRLEQSAGIFGPDSYAQENRAGTFLFYNNPRAFQWTNYSFSAAISSQDDDGLGLLFHYQNPSNYYKLELDAQRNWRRLSKKINGVETLLASQPGGYVVNRGFVLRAEIQDGVITARFNGASLFEPPVVDHDLTRGSVALYTWNNEGVFFDNVGVVAANQYLSLISTDSIPTSALPPPRLLTLISIDASWMFWPFDDPPGGGWNQVNHEDDDWPGPNLAIFANEPDGLPDPFNTSLSIGPITFYFRHRFTYTDSTLGVCLRLRHLIDDGAVFYLNGLEVLRTRMPTNSVSELTLAARDVNNAEYEGPFYLPETYLRAGDNVLAVEVHQSDYFSEDVVFGMELEALIPPALPVPVSDIRLLADQQLQLSVPGRAGRVYAVESSTNMLDWTTVATRTNFYGSLLYFSLPAPDAPQRFYRAVQVPVSCSER
jgi:hypothetical protein